MNCKPGDFAVLVNDEPGCECNIGAFVTVEKPAYPYPGEWGFSKATRLLRMNPAPGCADQSICWVTDGDGTGGVYVDYHFTIKDRYLRPIRDPGDDATDETLLWLPSPSLETA